MSFADDYFNELNKKKKKKQSYNSDNGVTAKNDYASEYFAALNEAPSPRTTSLFSDDIAPVSFDEYKERPKTIETTQAIYDKYGKYYHLPDYDEYSKKGADIENPTFNEAEGLNLFGWRPFSKEVSNIVTYSRDNVAEIAMGELQNASMVGKSKYRHMTDFEVGIYNYLLAKEGEKSAQEYLDDIEETLNARVGGQIAEKIQALDPVSSAIMHGTMSVGSGIESFGKGVKQLFSEEALPTTATAFTNQALLEDLDGFSRELYLAGNTVGNMAPSIVVGLINPIAGRILQSSSSAGNAYGQALKEGKSTEEAAAYGVMIGGMEYATSKLLSGVSGMTGKLPEKAMSKIATFENGLLRTGAKYGISLASEITEEEVQLWLEPFARTIAFGEDYDAPELEEMAETAIVTAISTGILNSTTDIATGQLTKVNGLTQHEAKVIEAEVENRIAEEEKSGKKLSSKEKEKIYNDVVEQMDKGQLDIDTIESVLGGETYKTYKNLTEQENTLQSQKNDIESEISDLVKTPESQFTIEQRERLNSLRAEAKGIEENIKALDTKTAKTNLFDEVYKLTEKDTRLRESYNERARRGQAFEADLTKYKGKQRDAIQRAIDSGVLNNTNRSHELVNTLSKIEADKGIVFDYTDNAKLKEAGFAVEGKTVNGFVKDGGVTLNVQSAKAWQSTVGHEITHVLEGTEAYSALREAVYAYAESKGELASRKTALTELYNGMNADIDSELTADLVGDYLFTDKDFINKLTGNRTLFQKVWDEVKYLCKVATGKELTEIEKVEREFARAWKEQGQIAQSEESGKVKYSISTDSEGKQLSKEQSEFFKDSKVRDDNGNLKVMYHGSPNADFTVFKSGTYFTEHKWYADLYQNQGASSLGYKKTANNPDTYAVYLDIKKPFDTRNKAERDIFYNEYYRQWGTGTDLMESGLPDWMDGQDLQEFLEEKGYDYDGLILDEGGVGGYGEEVTSRGLSYVVFSPEQVKNIDNTSPTSDPDIRFSLSKSVEETKDLVAVHNLWEGKLLKSLNLGGLPMPSIAIVRAKEGHENFGDISLVFGKETIDPKFMRDNKVYSADAWTPTYPQIEYKLNESAQEEIEKKINALVPSDVQRGLGGLYLDAYNLEHTLNRSSDIVSSYKNNYAMKYAFLRDSGVDLTLPMKNASLSRTGRLSDEAIIKVAETFSEEELLDILNGDDRYKYEPDVRNIVVESIKEKYRDKPHIAEALIPKEELPLGTLTNCAEDALNYKRNGIKQEIDYKEATALINDSTDATKYEAWLKDLFSNIVAKEGIRNNKDLYTPSGNRRSFEALHYEHTLENVVKAMREDGTIGIGGFGGSNILGSSVVEYGSIGEIKEKANERMKSLPQEEFDNIKRGFTDRFLELANSLPKHKDSFSALDAAANMLCEAVMKYRTKSGMANFLRKECEGWANYSDNVVDDLIELVNDIRNMPTSYFEAKPQRAVGFDEVATAIIPDNASAELKAKLTENNIPFIEYENGNEQARLEALNSVEDARFSLSNKGEQFAPTGNYSTPLNETALEQDIAPVATDEKTVPVAEEDMFPSEISPVDELAQLESRIEVVSAEKEALKNEFEQLYRQYAQQIITSEELQARRAELEPKYKKAAQEYDSLIDRISSIENAEKAQQREFFDGIREDDIPPEAEAPYYGEEAEPANPFENRDIKAVGNQKVKAYMYENPEVKPFFQEEAGRMLGELNNTQKGERWYNRDAYDYGYGADVPKVYGVSRQTSADIAYLLDELHYSYDQIRKGLNAIIEDNGEENNAVSKRIEFLLNDRLLYGYQDGFNGLEIPPNQDYVNLLNEKQITEYNEEAFKRFMENPSYLDDIAPVVEDVAENATTTDDDVVQVKENYIDEVYDALNNKKRKVDGYSFYFNRDSYNDGATITVKDAEGTTSKLRVDGGKYYTNSQLYYEAANFVADLKYGVTEDATTTSEENVTAPFPDAISPMTEEEANALQDEKAKADAKLEGDPKTRKQLHNNIINDIKATFSSGGYDFDDTLAKAKDLSTFSTVDNTPQRVMEKALGYKEGQVLADLTVNKVAQNETKGIKWLNSFTDRKNGLLAQISKEYNIKPRSKESAAAQMYAEGFYVDENNEIIEYGDRELATDFPKENVRNNIKGLAKDPRIRQIYDATLDAINKSRIRNAYPEIQKLDNYFLHFRAMEDTFSKLGLPFNPNDIKAKDLPTDLNGVTADLKPGQPYFASAMHRKGKRTSFDLLGGLERYLTSAKNQIYHIDDIQTLRAVRNYIADTYGQANGLEGIDALTEEEAQERIEQVYGSHLSTFAKFLNEEANILAGKTALIDRGLEGVIGRRGMTFLDTVRKQTGSNMVGFNVSSSLTNFLPVAQTLAKSNKFDFLKAFTQTASNKLGSIFGKGDNFAENSPVMIRRKGADKFHRTLFQKISDTGYFLMGAVDNISTELIARTKFNELTRKGMSEQQAHIETDKWVSRLMGDRSLGQMPQLYNSKTLGFITQFQLEVRNQLDSQFYDTIQEAKVSNEEIENNLARNAKTAAKVTSTFVQLAVVQHLFGKAFESVAGYNPAFDIIEVLSTMFGFDDEEDDEDTVLDNLSQGFLELLEDLPYTSAFTGGGRIPMSSALPISEVITGKDSYGNEKSRLETLGETIPYYVLPGGYGQGKKTLQGLGMFSDEHPIAGSYTDSSNLRFPVEDTPLNRIQAGIFGQYANANAREYFDNDYAPLKEKQIQEYIDVDLPIADYWKYREGLSGLKTNAEKADYINSLDIENWQKNLLLNNILDRKEDVDMSNYDDFSDYEEFDYAQKNPKKYEFLKENGISYSDFANADEDTKEFYSSAYESAKKNPAKKTMAKVVSGNYVDFYQHTRNINDIEGVDMNGDGKTDRGSVKENVHSYIFYEMDLDFGSKCILYKNKYKTDDTYNMDIINYINERGDLTYEERIAIFTELGFTVENGTVYW